MFMKTNSRSVRCCLSLLFACATATTLSAQSAPAKTIAISSQWIRALAFSPDGKTLASGGDDKMVRLWNVQTGKSVRVLRAGSGVNALAFSPDGKMLAGGGDDKTLRLWDARTGQSLRALRGFALGQEVQTVVFSPDGKLLAAGSSDGVGERGELRIWNLKTWRSTQVNRLSEGVSSLAFSRDGKMLASGRGSNDGEANIGGRAVVRWMNQKRTRSINEDSVVYSVAWAPNGSVALGNELDTAQIWNPSTGKIVHTFRAKSYIFAIDFSRDGKTLAVSDGDGNLVLWNAVTGQQKRQLLKGDENSSGIRALKFSPTGNTLAAAGEDGKIRLWSLK